MVRPAACVIALALAVSACGDDVPPAEAAQRDPVTVGALDDPLMTDPDLSTRNEGAAALTVRVDGPLPEMTLSPDAAASARADAALQLGDAVPEVPPASGPVAPVPSGHGPADHLAVLAPQTRCRAKLVDSAMWAARLPPALALYPRGATMAATGGDGVRCRVASVVYMAPVSADEALAYHWQRALAAGLQPARLSAGQAAVIAGKGKGTAFDVRIEPRGEQALVEVAAVTDLP